MSELLIVPDRSRAPASASIEILLIRNASNRSSVFYASLRANYLFFFSLLELLHSYVSQVCVSTSALCECVLVSCNDSSCDSSSPLSLYCRYQRSSGLIASARFSKTNWAPVNKKEKRKKVLIHSSSWQWFSSVSPNLEFMNPGYFCGSHRVHRNIRWRSWRGLRSKWQPNRMYKLSPDYHWYSSSSGPWPITNHALN